MVINEKTKLIVKLTETCHTFKQIADEFYRRTGYGITLPTVGEYLKGAWGDEYASKKKNMLKRYIIKRRLERKAMTKKERSEDTEGILKEMRDFDKLMKKNKEKMSD